MPTTGRPDIDALKKAMSRPLATWLDRLYEIEFQQLELHRKFIDEHFEAARTRLKAEFEKTYSALDKYDREDYAEYMVDDIQLLDETFPLVQWQAQFLVVYATFEASLNSLCNVVQRRLKSNLSFKDITGLGLERAKVYLIKVGGVDANQVFNNANWQRAMQLGKIRNLISHAQGRIDEAIDPRSAEMLRALKGLELKPVTDGATEHNVILSSPFVCDAISTLQAVIHTIAKFERDWPEMG